MARARSEIESCFYTLWTVVFRNSFTLHCSSKLGVILRYSGPHRVRPAASGNRLSKWHSTYYRQRALGIWFQLPRAQFYAIRCVLLVSPCRWRLVLQISRGSVTFASCSGAFGESNLVDPASSHMLVSKIKPCMSKYKFFTAKLWMAHYNSYYFLAGQLFLGYPW